MYADLTTAQLTQRALDNAKAIDHAAPSSATAKALLRQRAEIRGELSRRVAK